MFFAKILLHSAECKQPKTFFSIFAKILIKMREDRQLLVLLHLSQFFGGFIIPLILWQTKKEEVLGMDLHGKAVLNFQISVMIYSLVVAFLSLLCIGFFLLPFYLLYVFILPISNAINASHGHLPRYWAAIPIIK